MKALRKAAEAAIARLCAYAGLGILAVTALFASDLVLCLRVASGLTTVLAIFLLVRGRQVLNSDIRKSEIWAMLAPMDRRLADRARDAVADVLRAAYLRAAGMAAGTAAALWALALVASLAHQPAAG